MTTRTVCNCDTCGGEIDLSAGFHPARVNAYAPTPVEVGQQQEESHLCQGCWNKLCDVFPRFKEAERFTKPSPVPEPVLTAPGIMDTWPVEQKEKFLASLGAAMGLKIVRTEDK